MEKTLNKKILLFVIPLITSQLIFDLEIALRNNIYLIYLFLVLVSFYINVNSLNSEHTNLRKRVSIPARTKQLIMIPSVLLSVPIYIYTQSFDHLISLSGDYSYHASSMQHFNSVFSQTIRGIPLQLISLSFLFLLLIYIFFPRVGRNGSIFILSLLILNLIVIFYLSSNIHLGRYRYPAQIYFLGSFTEKILRFFSNSNFSGESLYYYQTLKLTNLIVFGVFVVCLVFVNRSMDTLVLPSVTILLSTNYFLFYLNSSYLDIASLLLIILCIFYYNYSGEFKLVYYYFVLSISTMFKEYGLIAILVSSFLFIIYKKHGWRIVTLYTILSCLPYATLYATQSMSTNEYIRPFTPSLPTFTYWVKWFENLSLLSFLFIVFFVLSFFSLKSINKNNLTLQISFLFTVSSILLFSVDITNTNNMGYSRFYLPLIVFVFFSFLIISEKVRIKRFSFFTHLISCMLLIFIIYSYPTNQSSYNFMEYTNSPLIVPKYSTEKKNVDLNIYQVWNERLINNEAFSIRCENTDGGETNLLYKKINYLDKNWTVGSDIEEFIERDSRYESCILDQGLIRNKTKLVYFDENILILES